MNFVKKVKLLSFMKTKKQELESKKDLASVYLKD